MSYSCSGMFLLNRICGLTESKGKQRNVLLLISEFFSFATAPAAPEKPCKDYSLLNVISCSRAMQSAPKIIY
jgi:hypothetical protein